MKDLSKTFDVDHGLSAGEVILPESIVTAQRSSKPYFTGDNLTAVDYFNSLDQITGNRIARSEFTYSSDRVATQTDYYYATDGATVLKSASYAYSYTGDNLTKVEVT